MAPELASTLQAISSVAILVVAIVSIVITQRAEKRNHERFQAGLNLSRDLAAANIRPVLSVYSQIGDELKSIILVNRGIGPAVVTSFEMKRGDESANNIKDLFDIGEDDLWAKWWRFPKGKIIISAGQEIVLGRLTKQYLLEHGCTEVAAESVLANWQQQKNGIELCFNYEDALGNIQNPYTTTLR